MCTSAQRTRTAARVRQTTEAVHVRRPRHNDSVAVAPPMVPLAASLQSQFSSPGTRWQQKASGAVLVLSCMGPREMRPTGQPLLDDVQAAVGKSTQHVGLTGVARMALGGLGGVGGGFASEDVIRVHGQSRLRRPGLPLAARRLVGCRAGARPARTRSLHAVCCSCTRMHTPTT